MPASDQGSLKGRYTLVPRTLIFLTRDDTVLLIKGAAQKKLWANLYNGIGGHVERGEDVLTSARRELGEEAGLYSPDLRVCGLITIDTGREVGVGIYVLTGECPFGEPFPSAEGQLVWLPKSRLDSIQLVEDLPSLLPLVLARVPGEPPFSAHYAYDQDGNLKINFAN